MLAEFVELCTVVFVVVDDIWREIESRFPRPGYPSEFSDSEVIALALISELMGTDKESRFLSFVRSNYLGLFPLLPERSRFNRRRRNLGLAINEVRRVLVQRMDLDADSWRIIDSLPVPVAAFCRAPQAKHWGAYGANFGKVASKKLTIFGFKLHFMVTLKGVVSDFVLAPANEADLRLVWDVTEGRWQLVVIGDKGYISEPERVALREERDIVLLTPRRRNQKDQLPPDVTRLLNDVRRMIETTGSQLTDQFNIQRNRAKSFWGLCARLYTKLAAHTLAAYLNQLFHLEPLRVAQLLTVK